MCTITDARQVNRIIILNKFMPINFKIKWANSYKNSTCQVKQRVIEDLTNSIFNKKQNPYWKIFPERKLQGEINLSLNSSKFSSISGRSGTSITWENTFQIVLWGQHILDTKTFHRQYNYWLISLVYTVRKITIKALVNRVRNTYYITTRLGLVQERMMHSFHIRTSMSISFME